MLRDLSSDRTILGQEKGGQWDMKLVSKHRKMKKTMEGRKGEKYSSSYSTVVRQRAQAQQPGLEGLPETAIGFTIPSKMPVV